MHSKYICVCVMYIFFLSRKQHFFSSALFLMLICYQLSLIHLTRCFYFLCTCFLYLSNEHNRKSKTKIKSNRKFDLRFWTLFSFIDFDAFMHTVEHTHNFCCCYFCYNLKFFTKTVFSIRNKKKNHQNFRIKFK